MRWASLAYTIGALSVATALFVFVLELGDLDRPDNNYDVNPFYVLILIGPAALIDTARTSSVCRT